MFLYIVDIADIIGMTSSAVVNNEMLDAYVYKGFERRAAYLHFSLQPSGDVISV